ncbi:MAG: hypothetical protein RR923_06705 [Bacilli bacterium]
MYKFKKIFSLGIIFALSLSVVACSSDKNSQKNNSQEKSVMKNQTDEKEDYKNVEYKNLEVKGITLEYPSFLQNKQNLENGTILSNKNNSINLEITQSTNNDTFKNIYEKDLKESKNITYKYLGETTYSISGYENETEYYKVAIQNKNLITTMVFTYPKEDASKLSDIIDKTYKSFKENKRQSNDKLQIATVDSSNLETDNEFSKLIILGDFEENKTYDIDYGSIIGKNLLNANTIDNKLEFNTVSFMGESINYPNFLKPTFIPGNMKSIGFASEDRKIQLYLGYRRNMVLDNEDGSGLLRENPETELNNMKEYSTILSNEVNGDYLYAATKPKEGGDIEFNISYFTDEVIQTATLSVDYNYYEGHKDKINQIYDEMKKTYKPNTTSGEM